MGIRNAPPHAGSMLESLRGLGYGTATALADLIDNSISANSKVVAIQVEWAGPESWVRIVDDGSGMDDATLETGMRLGARDPRVERATSDLGRFGLGLKTASFSQARRLTIASRQNGGPVVCLRWDLDLISQDLAPNGRCLKGLRRVLSTCLRRFTTWSMALSFFGKSLTG